MHWLAKNKSEFGMKGRCKAGERGHQAPCDASSELPGWRMQSEAWRIIFAEYHSAWDNGGPTCAIVEVYRWSSVETAGPA
jgi:hypothetical protein